ncbi:hypothetical protein AB1Y20_006620 [Prymnesium parvum]|uniref:Uncharacterized protein n=1 Tax=Prymnesium parvum TaxID=97485 RepID=A0AB34J0B8_PRYPA
MASVKHKAADMLDAFEDDDLTAPELEIASRVSSAAANDAPADEALTDSEEPREELPARSVDTPPSRPAEVAKDAKDAGGGGAATPPTREEVAAAPAAANAPSPEASVSPGHERMLSNGGASEASDFVYDDDDTPRGQEKRNTKLLYVLTAIHQADQLRSWVAKATDEEALALVQSVRYMQDSWMKSEAALINAQVDLQTFRQRSSSALLADQIHAAGERRASGSSIAESATEALPTKKMLEESKAATAAAQRQLAEERERSARLEKELAAKSAELEQVTLELQNSILRQKGLSEGTRKAKGSR